MSYIVVWWKYPGTEILSGLIEDQEEAEALADLERVRHKDAEQDIFVFQVTTDSHVYRGEWKKKR
jgi:hypothetical protein